MYFDIYIYIYVLEEKELGPKEHSRVVLDMLLSNIENSDRLKDTNLVESIDYLLPLKFRWIPFSGCRGEAQNVSANQAKSAMNMVVFQWARKTYSWK